MNRRNFTLLCVLTLPAVLAAAQGRGFTISNSRNGFTRTYARRVR